MKRATALLLVLSACHWACAQNTFIVHFDSIQDGRWGEVHGIEEIPGGFFLSGLQYSHDQFGQRHVFIRTIDSVGNFLTEREIWNGHNNQYWQGNFDPIDVDGDTIVASLIRWPPISPIPNSAIRQEFVKFDLQGDTIMTRLIADHPSSDSMALGLIQVRTLRGGGYVMVGSKQRINEVAQGWIVRINHQGDTLWTKSIGPTTSWNTLYGVEENVDGGFLLFGHRSGGGQNDNFLMRTDSLGNQIWRKQYGGDNGHSLNFARVAPDSSIITWSTYRDVAWTPSIYWVMELRKWDQSGNLVWSRLGQLFTSSQHATDLEVLPDGSVICAMNHTGVAGLWKFNSNGDSLWQRQYWVFSGPGGGMTSINDVLVTSDSGFAFCGMSEQGNTDPTPDLRTWYVIKTDSLGCVIPGCHLVGVQEYEITLQDQLHIGPNPATDHINLTLDIPPNYPLTGQLQAVLLDAQGRTVRTQALVHTGTQVRGTLAVGDLPRGLYLLHVTDAKMWLAGSKVVLE